MRDIDLIIQTLKAAHPDLIAEQLKVRHPGDDDGLWFFRHASTPYEVQLESGAGSCPFLFETDEDTIRRTADTVAEAIRLVERGLGLA
ncbi:hypothetical protein LVB77_15800 [Lysobacter sp. 5GHs7-4]|uniref:hypothetical protein n=1 Tax=Lysobacter sp. 5GHs7-4 TaxID=2904253 RepID=UPI001E2A4D51|nr:hypothetical protein [Lysobacter sp. 5GHs7-4]UHQ22119.1 hypothetical protein LVB77_15800 [Lysobacter sp. 5GHs7-4]